MPEGKSSYASVKRKRAIRDEIIPRHKFDVVIGLGGPNIDIYAEEMRRKGFRKIISYELDLDVYMKQGSKVKTIKGIEIELNLGDITEAPLFKDVFYDIDLCCTVAKAHEPIKKFRKNCTFTFSMQNRRMNKALSIHEFFSIRNETILKINKIMDTLEFIQTNKGLYKLLGYRDGAPMLTITKIK